MYIRRVIDATLTLTDGHGARWLLYLDAMIACDPEIVVPMQRAKEDEPTWDEVDAKSQERRGSHIGDEENAVDEKGAVLVRDNNDGSSTKTPFSSAGDDGNEGNIDLLANCEGTVPQVFLTVRGHPVTFREDWGAGIGGGLWSTGLALARYLDTDHAYESFSELWAAHRGLSTQHPRPKDNADNAGALLRSESAEAESAPLRFVELGSGNGLLSACWLALAKSIASSTSGGSDPTTQPSRGHEHVLCELYVTDTQDHLFLIRSTLAANSHLVCHETSQVQVMEYEWGKDWPDTNRVHNSDNDDLSTLPTTAKSLPTFDIIFGSDVAYRPELYAPLIASLTQLSNCQTRIYLGVTMADTCPDFFHKLTRAGFVYRKLDDALLEPEYQGLTFGIFVVQRHVPWYRPGTAATEPLPSDGGNVKPESFR
jgi:Lysine methyltransferase